MNGAEDLVAEPDRTRGSGDTPRGGPQRERIAPAARRGLAGSPLAGGAALALLVGSSILLTTSCGNPAASTSTGSRPGAPGSPAADEAVVTTAPVEDVFLMTGELSAVHSLALVTPKSDTWRVQIKWLAEDGSEVKEGDKVIEFDNSAIAQTIEEKRLRVIQSEIDLESKQAQLAADGEDKRFAFERAKNEAEKARVDAAIPAEIRPRREWQEAQLKLRRAESALEKAKLELDAFETSSKADLEILRIARDKASREIDDAQRTLDALSLKAPRAGIFIVGENENEDRKYQNGDTCWPGQMIGSIPDLSSMEVTAYLTDVDDGRVSEGQKARCILDTYPERIFTGKIEEIARVADRKGFKTRISLEGADPNLMRPGMSVRLEVVRRSWPSALTVPRQAVRLAEGRTFVAKTGVKEPVEVRLAACTPQTCVVESGLSEGDRVDLR